MRSKSLLSVLAIAALTLSIGCGGGGGGGGGESVDSRVTVSGEVKTPATVNSNWSVRNSISTLATPTLTVQAFGANGTSVSDAQTIGSDGKFSLKVYPDNDCIIKATNGKFEFQYHFGILSGAKSSIDVDATSTARAFVNWRRGYVVEMPDGDSNLSTLVNSILAALSVTPTVSGSETLFNQLKDAATMVATAYSADTSAIRTANTSLQNIFVNAKSNPELIEGARTYVSSGLNSTAEIPRYGLEDFIAATKSRYQRYNVNTYTFEIREIRFTSADTAKVSVTLSINVTSKADGLTSSYGPVESVIIWKKESGTWRVYQDFPYRREQFNF